MPSQRSAGERSPSLLSALPQPSLLYKCQLTTTDTDGEQKHRRTGKGREPPTGVRKQEDSTHTVQERILPDNIINSFTLNFFFFLDFNLLFFSTFLHYLCFQRMPYENLGIIKVPERIARFSACIAVCIYTVVMYRDGPKTDCSTVLGLFTSRSEGEVNVITTDGGVGG